MNSISLERLRRYAIARTLFAPTTLARALHKLGFLQADPIRAPARAQDLTLRHRVKHYRAGDLERRYASLEIEEDFFVNYGFLPRAHYALMHPRRVPSHRAWDSAKRRRAAELLRFVHTRGVVHPRAAEQEFDLGQVKNYWGGSSSATTHLLDALHYGGTLRIARRERGVRLYTAFTLPAALKSARERRLRVDALIDLVVHAYAPLPSLSLSNLVSRLRFAVPQWQSELKPGLARAKQRLAHTNLAGIEWYWPADEKPASSRHDGANAERVRLLAPFDPLVWDRRRFELFWGWAYRFEAYTPPAKRKLGYYALPLLWRDRLVGWGNLSLRNGVLDAAFGFVDQRPDEPGFDRELEAELAHMRRFLAAEGGGE